MKKSLLQLVVCPLCGGPLTSETFEASAPDEISAGLLTCGCGAGYPVIGGIPRLLPPELQTMLWEMHPAFFRRYRDVLPAQFRTEVRRQDEPSDDDRAVTLQRETARSFGYEWQAFSEMLTDYEANFRWYFERFDPSQFAGKRVLDAGCGTGRHTFHMARSGVEEVVAMDLSQAIEVAAHNNRDHPNTHFVQADIYRPPFRPETFDFLYSLGVLHHLPDPEKGFQRLLPLLGDGDFLNIYLYWNLEGEAAWRRAALRAVTQFRRVTTRLPHALLKKFSWLIAVGFYFALVIPSRWLECFGPTRSLADLVPLGHYRRYSFRVIYTDQFDRFSAPIENRYSRAEVLAWFERAGLTDVVILGGAGWRASGRRVISSPRDKEEESNAQCLAGVREE